MNRQQRRQQERKMARAAVSGKMKDVQKPTGEFGVDVSRDDNNLYITFMQGNGHFTIQYSHADALIVSKLIADAVEENKAVEIVRQSGLVVPPKGMQL